MTVLPCSPLDQIDAAVDAGFDAVGLRLIPGMASDIDVMSDMRLQQAIARRIAATRLDVLDIEVVRVTPETDVAAVAPVLEFAGGLGARWLTVTSAAVDSYRPAEEPVVVQLLSELCKAAARHGMGVMLEFMAFRGISTLGDAVRVVTAVGCPNLGIVLDALHFFRSGGTVSALDEVDSRLLACVQLCDAPRTAPADLASEARRERLYPGEGELPLRELMSALPRDLPVSVEAPSRSRAHLSVSERASESARWTRRLLGTTLD
jgi:sugar phosphate isomerase/epimerase